MLKYVFLSFILFFSSCLSYMADDGDPRSLEEVLRRRLDSYVEKEDFEIFSVLSNQQHAALLGDDWDRYYSQALQNFNKQYEESWKTLNYSQYMSFHRFATQKGLDLFGSPYEFYRRLLSERESEENPLALYYALLAGQNQALSNTDLQYYAELAFSGNSALALRSLAQEAPESHPEWTDMIRNAASKDKQLQGTVTVWVNKGVKISGGVALADRVIGSGFFIDRQGYLLTNYHVIESEVNPQYDGYSRLFIRLPGSSDRIPAKVVGWDPVFDIALLKTSYTPAYVFSLLPARTPKPGEAVYAIGSPGGLDQTVSSGILSAVKRPFLELGEVYQIDAPVNQGNSGGPLLNQSGEVIGIIYAGIDFFEGVNFALPIDQIIQLLPQLYEGGLVQHAFLGAGFAETNKGLELIYVHPNSTLKILGAMPGDLLQSIAGEKPQSLSDLYSIVMQSAVNTPVNLELSRNSELLKGVAVWRERPERLAESLFSTDTAEALIPLFFGMNVELVRSSFFQSTYRISTVFKNSQADEFGLSEHDPFTIKRWQLDKKAGFLVLQLTVQKRKMGFMEVTAQMSSPLWLNNLF